jgi:hypothetical protein
MHIAVEESVEVPGETRQAARAVDGESARLGNQDPNTRDISGCGLWEIPGIERSFGCVIL